MTDNDLERRLENWARWKRGGGGDGGFVRRGGSTGVSSIYSTYLSTRNARSGYRQARVPLLVLEAQQTDHAIAAMQPELGDVLNAWYARRDPAGMWIDADAMQDELAGRCGCTLRTFQRRLHEARAAVVACLPRPRQAEP